MLLEVLGEKARKNFGGKFKFEHTEILLNILFITFKYIFIFVYTISNL